MLAKILSGATVGLDAMRITVEVDIASQGLPSFTIVGLPDKAVEESKERVRAAIKNSGAEFPAKRITVNLAPADVPKIGPSYDLPIALGILIASGQLIPPAKEALYVGELSLDGAARHTNGILSLALLAQKEHIPAIFVPAPDAPEAAVVSGVAVYPVTSLLRLFRHLHGHEVIDPLPTVSLASLADDHMGEGDLADIHGQDQAKRALEIAAAGGHNVFLYGPPGSGKTMLARAFPSILPSLSETEALEVTKIYSVTGNLPPGQSIMKHRPFRAPHHTTSRIGLIGGGTHPAPGEISLAHRGVLFLDEFPEFPRHVLEALRQPLEDGVVTISRAAGSVSFPATFMLVAASNPCPCGNFGSETKKCTCLPGTVRRYQKRVSGPIMDRVDLHVWVPAVKTEKLVEDAHANPSSFVREKVEKARAIQRKRLAPYNLESNAEMSTKQAKELCALTAEAQTMLTQAVNKYALSARSYYRMMKVARTMADIDGKNEVTGNHIAEALQFRPTERFS